MLLPVCENASEGVATKREQSEEEAGKMEMMTAEQAAEAAKGLTFEKVWEALMETRAQMQESHEKMREEIRESRKRDEETLKELKKSVDNTNKIVGKLGNTIGNFIEEMFSANLQEKFNKYGYTFKNRYRNCVYKEENRTIAEVDAVLENGEYMMLLEVKTDLKESNIDDHVERMEIMRKYMDSRGDNRKLLGAVAGGVVSESAMRYAQKRGFYVIMQAGESVEIAEPPEGFKAQIW